MACTKLHLPYIRCRCGKVGYATPDEAREALEILSARNRAAGLAYQTLAIYWSAKCQTHHVGHEIEPAVPLRMHDTPMRHPSTHKPNL
jgi:hypothetical protein